jgi:hypothetical protein
MRFPRGVMPSPLFFSDKEIAMKNGRSLVSLAQELERQLHSKKDLIVPSTLVRHATDDLGSTRLVIEEGGSPVHYGVTPWRVASWRTS